MAKIRWSKDSISGLKDIHDYIFEDSPRYASIVIERIIEMAEHLENFPEMGRRVPESDNPDVREIFYKDYRIIYQLNADYLEIIIVIHGRRILHL